MLHCLFVTAPGFETALLDELHRLYPGRRHLKRSPGWLESFFEPSDLQPEHLLAFSHQCLPSPAPLRCLSINEFARAIAERIVAELNDDVRPWRLHTFCVDIPKGPVGQVRCRRIEATVVELLQRYHYRLLRQRQSFFAAPIGLDETVVQVGLENNRLGWMSVTRPETMAQYRSIISRFSGGLASITPLPNAPSIAHRKLLEAELHLHRYIAPGDRCVDLGGAPGGWSYVALDRGAHVVAVDRSPLHPDLMVYQRLTFIRGDAFRFTPSQPVTWLLCDVIAFPEKTITLLEHWLTSQWCQFFCVTVKFRGQEGYWRAESIKSLLREKATFGQVRRLASNHNELTVIGECLRK